MSSFQIQASLGGGVFQPSITENEPQNALSSGREHKKRTL